ncbi:MAG: ribonuclease D, partial [Candidatus Sericytochromatia bacterium]
MFQIEYINNNKLLDSCIKYLSSVNSFAFDLEFDHYRFSYGFNLCLIQIATDKRCFVIDPISKIDLNPLFDLFEDEKILKIVHSSGEDLRLLNQMNCYPKNLFDTDIVTKFLNYDLTSLSAML